MLKLDQLTIVAPTLSEGVVHVHSCLGIDVPFGQRHLYMGTHNHLLRLGGGVYLEVIAIDPDGISPGLARWFGLDNSETVKADWADGRRLRGWVARTDAIDTTLSGREGIFGRKVPLPSDDSKFDFSIPEDGSLPLDGAAPSLIDRRGKPRSMNGIADLGAKLVSFSLEHPASAMISELYQEIGVDDGPDIISADILRYRARIETAHGIRELF